MANPSTLSDSELVALKQLISAVTDVLGLPGERRERLAEYVLAHGTNDVAGEDPRLDGAVGDCLDVLIDLG